MESVDFTKDIVVDDKTVFLKANLQNGLYKWNLCFLDGRIIGTAESRENAIIMAMQYKLKPVTLQ